MSNMRIVSRNVHDEAELTVTSELLPVINTQRSRRSRIWRSKDAGTQVIEGVLTQAENIDCVALARHNLGSGGAVQIEMFYGDDRVYDSGAIALALLIPAGVWRAGIDPWGGSFNEQLPSDSDLVVHWTRRVVVADRYRLTLTRMGNAELPSMEVGRILVGLSYEVDVNFDWGVRVEWQESSEHLKTEGGSLVTVGQGDLRRRFALDLSFIDMRDRQMLLSNLVSVGMHADVLVALYPDAEGLLNLEHTMICRRQGTWGHTYDYYHNWSSSLEFLEV
ncbi:hypothetical protein [Terasakiispira papahanaumokuakeensis]|nr:hypothetical protein [Terasakiispira papahanaumokuakeensis]